MSGWLAHRWTFHLQFKTTAAYMILMSSVCKSLTRQQRSMVSVLKSGCRPMKRPATGLWLLVLGVVRLVQLQLQQLEWNAKTGCGPVSCTKHVWYSEHGTYYQFKFILEWAMSATHVAVILRMRTGPAYEEESMKTDYPDARNEYGMS